MSLEAFRIDVLTPADIERAAQFFNYDRISYDDTALRHNMAAGRFTVVLAKAGSEDVGGFYLNHAPKYALYQRLNLPEMQDLRVSPGHRRQGIATALVAKAEKLAQAAGAKGMGLSVGLYADYGPAQHLYIKMGYVPDGQGITYDRVSVQPGESKRVDDDLCLMLLKFF